MRRWYTRLTLIAVAIGVLAYIPTGWADLTAGSRSAAAPAADAARTTDTAGTATGASTSVTINGKARSGSVFDGVGAISGGGGDSRLLIDYPEPQRTQILQYLFKPGYGADVQILKIEIGGDGEATDGAEPSFEHTKGQINCNAGYEMWLAKQARELNPHITLDALQWNGPGWIGHGQEDPWTQTDISYLLSWLNCAKKDGLGRVDYLGGWDEHLRNGRVTPAIMTWFIDLRAALNKHGYGYIKIVGVDTPRRNPDVSNFMASDPAFGRAINVIGYHDICQYPTTGLICQIPTAARKSGKPIWATEVGALRMPGGTAALARTINNAYIQAEVTGIIEYPLITAMPGGMPEEDRGLIQDSQPWSGYYTVSPLTWVIAQTTQFTAPGWVHVAGASGVLNGKSDGSYVSYENASHKEWTLVAQTTDAAGSQNLTVHVTGGLPDTTVHVWSTSTADNSTPSQWFVNQGSITPVNGKFTFTMQKGSVYTFTTTTGQAPGSTSPSTPAPTPQPLPYSTSASAGAPFGPDGTGMPWGLEPADGSFEYTTIKGTNTYEPYFEQTTAGRPDFWQPIVKSDILRFPYAIAGDYCLGDVAPEPKNIGNQNTVPAWCPSVTAANYTVSATVQFTSNTQSAGVIARYYRPTTTPIQYFQGYQLIVTASGTWRVQRASLSAKPVELAHGTFTAPGTSGTTTFSLQVSGPNLTAVVAGTPVYTGTDSNYSTGVAGLSAGGWYPVHYLNFTITS
jgi:hypothetical protein